MIGIVQAAGGRASIVEIVSFVAGVSGTAFTVIGIAISVYLYKKAKSDSARAEDTIAQTLAVSEESKRLLDAANKALETTAADIQASQATALLTQAVLNETSDRLAELLQEQAVLISSSTVVTFIESILQRAEDGKRQLSVGDLWEAVGRTPWTKRDADDALDDLLRLDRVVADGPPRVSTTPVRLRPPRSNLHDARRE